MEPSLHSTSSSDSSKERKCRHLRIVFILAMVFTTRVNLQSPHATPEKFRVYQLSSSGSLPFASKYLGEHKKETKLIPKRPTGTIVLNRQTLGHGNNESEYLTLAVLMSELADFEKWIEHDGLIPIKVTHLYDLNTPPALKVWNTSIPYTNESIPKLLKGMQTLANKKNMKPVFDRIATSIHPTAEDGNMMIVAFGMSEDLEKYDGIFSGPNLGIFPNAKITHADLHTTYYEEFVTNSPGAFAFTLGNDGYPSSFQDHFTGFTKMYGGIFNLPLDGYTVRHTVDDIAVIGKPDNFREHPNPDIVSALSSLAGLRLAYLPRSNHASVTNFLLRPIDGVLLSSRTEHVARIFDIVHPIGGIVTMTSLGNENVQLHINEVMQMLENETQAIDTSTAELDKISTRLRAESSTGQLPIGSAIVTTGTEMTPKRLKTMLADAAKHRFAVYEFPDDDHFTNPDDVSNLTVAVKMSTGVVAYSPTIRYTGILNLDPIALAHLLTADTAKVAAKSQHYLNTTPNALAEILSRVEPLRPTPMSIGYELYSEIRKEVRPLHDLDSHSLIVLNKATIKEVKALSAESKAPGLKPNKPDPPPPVTPIVQKAIEPADKLVPDTLRNLFGSHVASHADLSLEIRAELPEQLHDRITAYINYLGPSDSETHPLMLDKIEFWLNERYDPDKDKTPSAEVRSVLRLKNRMTNNVTEAKKLIVLIDEHMGKYYSLFEGLEILDSPAPISEDDKNEIRILATKAGISFNKIESTKNTAAKKLLIPHVEPNLINLCIRKYLIEVIGIEESKKQGTENTLTD